MASPPRYKDSLSVDWAKFYEGIVPPQEARRPTTQQMQAIRDVGPNGLDRLPSGSAGLPNPSPGHGLTQAQIAGLGGRTVDGGVVCAYVPPSQENPALVAAGGMAGGVSLPRPRPWNAPNRMDLAAWYELNGGGSAPAATIAPRANPAVHQALAARIPAPAPKVRVPTPAERYAMTNRASQAAATSKRDSLSGVGTNGYTYQNGVNVGYSEAEKASRAARGKAIGDANRRSASPSYNVSGSNNSFSPRSVQNSVRQQTGY